MGLGFTLGYTLGWSIITASMWMSNNNTGATIMTILFIAITFIPTQRKK